MRAAGEAGRRKGLPNTLSQREILLGLHLKELGYGDYQREFQFYPERKWRFDFAVVRNDGLKSALKLAIEIEGGIWTQGRHTRGQGFLNDCEKYNTAVIFGWDVLRFSVDDVLNGQARETLRQYKKVREAR